MHSIPRLCDFLSARLTWQRWGKWAAPQTGSYCRTAMFAEPRENSQIAVPSPVPCLYVYSLWLWLLLPPPQFTVGRAVRHGRRVGSPYSVDWNGVLDHRTTGARNWFGRLHWTPCTILCFDNFGFVSLYLTFHVFILLIVDWMFSQEDWWILKPDSLMWINWLGIMYSSLLSSK